MSIFELWAYRHVRQAVLSPEMRQMLESELRAAGATAAQIEAFRKKFDEKSQEISGDGNFGF